MPVAEVIKLQDRNVQDIPRALRELADKAEKGELGACLNFAFVIDVGDGQVECGLLGPCAEARAAGHLLLAKGVRALEIG